MDLLKTHTGEAVAAWLDGPTANADLNKYAHWGAIAAGAGMSWVASKVGPVGITAATAELVNSVTDVFNDPNIEGIPIKAETQRVSRDVDVSMQMLVAQEEKGAGGKQWVTDNAAPRPRVWQVRGYLQSLSNLMDGYFVVRPTLLLQLALLDNFAASRRPVWFKAHYSLFYQVLIEHFDYEFDPKTQNSVLVNLTLCEYAVNIAYSDRAGQKAGERTGDPLSSSGEQSILDNVVR